MTATLPLPDRRTHLGGEAADAGFPAFVPNQSSQSHPVHFTGSVEGPYSGGEH